MSNLFEIKFKSTNDLNFFHVIPNEFMGYDLFNQLGFDSKKITNEMQCVGVEYNVTNISKHIYPLTFKQALKYKEKLEHPNLLKSRQRITIRISEYTVKQAIYSKYLSICNKIIVSIDWDLIFANWIEMIYPVDFFPLHFKLDLSLTPPDPNEFINNAPEFDQEDIDITTNVFEKWREKIFPKKRKK